MLPVLSTLRRVPTKLVYSLEPKFRLPRPCQVYNFAADSWEQTSSAKLYCFTFSGNSELEVAGRLWHFENTITKKLNLLEIQFSLLIGPESESLVGGVYTRTSRFAIVQGILHPKEPVAPRQITKPPK